MLIWPLLFLLVWLAYGLGRALVIVLFGEIVSRMVLTGSVGEFLRVFVPWSEG